MPAEKDLTGQRFGRLLVLGKAPEPYISPSGKKTIRWICRCDCGKEITVLRNALTSTSNPTRSCGCARAETIRAKAKDLTGKRYGRLTILGPVELDHPDPNGGRISWRARCDCGNEITVRYKDLLSGRVLSCGCLLRETARKKVEDNVFGFFDGTQLPAIRVDRGPNSNSHTGIRGVYWSSRERTYIAKIGFRGKSITIGRFERLEDAEKARAEAEEKYFAPIWDQYNQFEKDKKSPDEP